MIISGKVRNKCGLETFLVNMLMYRKEYKVNLRVLVYQAVITLLLFQTALAEINLTVHDAIDLALENNESYLIAKKELEKARNQIYEVRASALPQLSASFNVLRNWELPSFVIDFDGEPMNLRAGTYYSLTSSLTITQPIYNGGRVFSALSAAKLYKKFSIEQLKMQEQQLKYDVIAAFHGTIMAEDLLRVARQSVELAQAGLDVVKKMEAQGTVSDFEVLMAEVRLANAKPQLIEADAAARLANEALNNLIGLSLNERINLLYDMDSSLYIIPEFDLDSARISSLEKRPEIKMMRLQNKMLKKAVSIAKAGYRPSINLLTTLQFQAQYDDNRWPDRKDWNRSALTAISISIPIFDSWKTPSRVKQAKLELSQSKLSEKELEDNLKLEIEQSWWNYQKARESLASQGHSVEMAKRGLAIARLRYENGVGTQLEMFEAEMSLTVAETNRAKAFYDLVTGYAALMKTLGEEDLIR